MPTPRPVWGAWGPADDAGLGPKESLPDGLKDLLQQSGQAPQPLRWQVRDESLKKLLDKPVAVKPERLELETSLSDALLDALTNARARLLEAIQPFAKESPIVALASAPRTLLCVPAVLEAAQHLLDTWKVLLAAQPSHAAASVVLNLETLLLVCEGVSWRLLSPLHPLWLAQQVQLARQLATVAQERDQALRLFIARALRGQVVLPPRWPGEPELEQAPVKHGLFWFGARSLLPPDALAGLTGRLLALLLDLHPATRQSARVVLAVADPAPALKAIGALLSVNPFPETLHVVVGQGHRAAAGADALDSLIQSGRLVLEPLHPDGNRYANLTLLESEPLQGVAQGPEPEGSPNHDGSAEVLLETLDRVLPAKSEPVEPVQPVTAQALAISSCPKACFDALWTVMLAPKLSGPLPTGLHVLGHEQQEGYEVMLLSRSLEGTARRLAPVFRGLGFQDQRTSSALRLTQRLAQGGGGLLSLVTDGAQAPVAARLALAAWRARLGQGVRVVRLSGAGVERLLGPLEGVDLKTAWSLAVTLREERVVLGLSFATLQAGPVLEKRPQGWTGEPLVPLARGLERLSLAGQGGSALGPRLARALVAELLWPALTRAEWPALEERLSCAQPWKLERQALIVAPGWEEDAGVSPPRAAGVVIEGRRASLELLELG